MIRCSTYPRDVVDTKDSSLVGPRATGLHRCGRSLGAIEEVIKVIIHARCVHAEGLLVCVVYVLSLSFGDILLLRSKGQIAGLMDLEIVDLRLADGALHVFLANDVESASETGRTEWVCTGLQNGNGAGRTTADGAGRGGRDSRLGHFLVEKHVRRRVIIDMIRERREVERVVQVQRQGLRVRLHRCRWREGRWVRDEFIFVDVAEVRVHGLHRSSAGTRVVSKRALTCPKAGLRRVCAGSVTVPRSLYLFSRAGFGGGVFRKLAGENANDCVCGARAGVDS